MPEDLARHVDTKRGEVPFARYVALALERGLGITPVEADLAPAVRRDLHRGPMPPVRAKHVDPNALARQASMNRGKS